MSPHRRPFHHSLSTDGDFDFPPASTSLLNDPTIGSLTARFQDLRHILQQERDDLNLVRELAADARETLRAAAAHPSLSMPRRPSPFPPRPRSSRLASLRRSRDEFLAEANADLAFLRETAAMATDRLQRLAPPPAPGRSSRERSVYGSHAGSAPGPSLRDELIDFSPAPETDPEPQDAPRNAKRRKLNHGGSSLTGFDPVRYGWKGQVDPGNLQLEIVSCDGGEYGHIRDLHSPHRPENILRNDESVYCTKTSKCNILLRHQAETAFHLESIVIKAPEHGYTAPLQEGLIFVGMSADKLIHGSSAYRLQYDGAGSSRASTPPAGTGDGDQERLTLLQSLNDRQIYLASMQRNRENISQFSGQGSNAATAASDDPSENQYSLYLDDAVFSFPDNCEWPPLEPTVSSSSNRAEFTTAPTPPPFTVTAEDSDGDGDSSDSDEPLGFPFPRHLEADDTYDGPRPYRRRHNIARSQLHAMLRSQERARRDRFGRRTTPSRIAPRRGTASSEVLQPNARFFIRRHRSKTTIRFNPPVAGRYILLKLFSPHDDGGNIDIEFVGAHGYSGPRFFPAVEFA